MSTHSLDAYERLKLNIPRPLAETRRDRWRVLSRMLVTAVVLICVAAVAALLIHHSATSAHAQDAFVRAGSPRIVAIGSPGCLNCFQFEQDQPTRFAGLSISHESRMSPESEAAFRATFRTVPDHEWRQIIAEQNRRNDRTFDVIPASNSEMLFPMFVAAGGREYWIGYTQSEAPALRGWMESQPPQRTHAVGQSASLRFQSPSVSGEVSMPSQETGTPVAQDLEGVGVIIVCDELVSFMEGTRRKAANTVANSVEELTHEYLGNKAYSRFVAKINQPVLFDRLEELSGIEAEPLAIHVLVPKTKQGLIKSIILPQIEKVLQNSVFDKLKEFPIAKVNVVIERISGGLYEATKSAIEAPMEEIPVNASIVDRVKTHVTPADAPPTEDVPYFLSSFAAALVYMKEKAKAFLGRIGV